MAKRRRYSRKKSKKGIRRRRGARRSKVLRGGAKGKFAHALKRLKTLNCNHQAQAMSLANDKFIRQFCCHVKKLKHAKLPAKTAAGLKRHALKIRKLISAKTSVKAKRKMLSKRGGFLQYVLPPIIGLVASSLFRMRR